MHRFFVPTASQSRIGDIVALSESDARHASLVLRLTTGDPVCLLDGRGGELEASLVSVTRREVSARIGGRHDHPRDLPTRTLAAGLTKGKAWDLTLQKATELGVHRIVPVACERSVAVIDKADAGAKVERWSATVIEAAKQCGTRWLPEILPPCRIADLPLPASARHRWILADLADDARPLHTAFSCLGDVEEVVLWVGPEGDFTPTERAQLRAAGAIPVRLGPRVLRAETAAAAMLANLEYELDRIASAGS